MPNDEPTKPARSKERELEWIEERIQEAEKGSPSGRLIRKALLSGKLSTDVVRAAARNEKFRAYLVAWLEINERAALAGEEDVLSIEEVANRIMTYYGVEPNRP